MTATQGVVFALGGEKRFGGLVTQDSPRCLLDLGFQPMAWYALRALERANVLDVFLVAAGEHSAARFEDFVREQYKGPCRVAVVAAAEDADSADALRAVADRLTSRSVAVLSGDLVTDVALADVLDTHDSAGARAVATCVYARRRPWHAVETKTGRPPKGATYVGLSDDSRLLFAADGDDVDKILKLRRPMLNRVSSLEVRTDLSDANMYVFRTKSILRLLEREPRMRSLQLDAVPAMARHQFASAEPDADALDADEADDVGLMRAVLGGVETDATRAWKDTVLAYLAPDAAYCARAETLSPAYSEMARELAAADSAAHLLGRPASKYENFVAGSVVIGARATVGPGCIVNEDASLGEKCSVKRSVVGEGASIGSGAKLINSVVMPRAVVEDGCVVQGCVVGPRAVVGAGTSLRECLVAAEYEVDEGEDFRGETLAEKTR